MEKNEVVKVKKGISKDKIVIFSIVGVMLLISLAITGYYFYNNNFKSVATYDGGKIDMSEYTIYYNIFSPILKDYGYPDEMIPEQIAYKAASDEILLKLANESNIILSDEDIAEIDEIVNNEAQIEELRNRGLDKSQIKELYKNDALMTNYVSYLSESLTEEEMVTYLKEQYGEDFSAIGYNTSHILILNTDDEGNKYEGEALEDAKNRANAALDRVKAGEDFATIAKEVSEDTGSKNDGGEYTVYLDGSTVEEYETAAKNLEIGAYTTELVETEYGYHIIKLNSIDEKARINDEYERQSLAYSNLGDLTEEYNLEYDYDALEVVHEKITGNVIELTDPDEVDVYSETE